MYVFSGKQPYVSKTVGMNVDNIDVCFCMNMCNKFFQYSTFDALFEKHNSIYNKDSISVNC